MHDLGDERVDWKRITFVKNRFTRNPHTGELVGLTFHFIREGFLRVVMDDAKRHWTHVAIETHITVFEIIEH